MRGRHDMAVAVRAGSGEIVVWSEPIEMSRLTGQVRHWPLVRGAVLLWDMMLLGMRALVFAAAVGATADGKIVSARSRHRSLGATNRWSVLVTVAASILFSIGLFFVGPLATAAWLDQWVDSAFVSNVFEGLIRLGLLVGYIYGIGFLSDIQRVYAYHGAEHQTIHAWEAGVPLRVDLVRQFPLAHPRCGTGFILIVVLLSLVVFVALGEFSLTARVISRVALVPVIASAADELLRLAAKHPAHPWSRLLLRPGLDLQHLTTRTPDDRMREVAIAALLRVLAADGQIRDDDPRLTSVRRVDAALRPLAAV